MYLHDNKELFKDIINETAITLDIPAAIAEKDYYVTVFLREILSKQPDIVFKGGTSLSKCYKLINRFSEDIDLGVQSKEHPTESQRRKLKANIMSIIDLFGFTLTNPDDVRSRKDFNRYMIDYPSLSTSAFLKPRLIVETALYISSYPVKRKTAMSFVYEYLAENSHTDIIKKYNLQPFEVNVQSAERTLADKLFALCDYYLSGDIGGHSRHIYDIYKLTEIVPMNVDLKQLINEVRIERKKHRAYLSAQDGTNVKDLLNMIICKEAYRDDYENISSTLLFERVPYDIAIEALRQIAGSDLFD